MVLGKAASSLDKNIDPLDCKVINSLLIESQDSSSTDRMLPLSFSSPWMLLKQSIYQENCTSRVLARTGQLPSLLSKPARTRKGATEVLGPSFDVFSFLSFCVPPHLLNPISHQRHHRLLT